MSHADPTNEDRAEWAHRACETFQQATHMHSEELETIIPDLLADLRHLADSHGIDWAYANERADDHYSEEAATEAVTT